MRGDGEREVVVPRLHAKVARQAAASLQAQYARSEGFQERLVGVPSHDGVVVTVRLSNDRDAAQVGQAARRVGHGGQRLGERVRRARDEGAAGVLGQQITQVVAQHGRARGLHADDGNPGGGEGGERGEQCRQVLLRSRQLSGRNPRESAARVGRDDGGEAVRVEHVHDSARTRVVEGLAEGVRPHERVRPPAGIVRAAQDRGIRQRRGSGRLALAG